MEMIRTYHVLFGWPSSLLEVYHLAIIVQCEANLNANLHDNLNCQANTNAEWPIRTHVYCQHMKKFHMPIFDRSLELNKAEK